MGSRSRQLAARESMARRKRVADKLGFKLSPEGHPISAGYPQPGIYILDADDYIREYRGEDQYALNGNTIELQAYKGHVLLSVEPKPNEDTKAAARLGLRLGASAWLDGNEFDELITLLREAKRVWLAEHRMRMAIARCRNCPTGSLCVRHRNAIHALCEKTKALCTSPKKRRAKGR